MAKRGSHYTTTRSHCRERLKAAADKLATINLTTEEAVRCGAKLASVNTEIGRRDSNVAERLDVLEAAVRGERARMLLAWMRGLSMTTSDRMRNSFESIRPETDVRRRS